MQYKLKVKLEDLIEQTTKSLAKLTVPVILIHLSSVAESPLRQESHVRRISSVSDWMSLIQRGNAASIRGTMVDSARQDDGGSDT